VTTSLLLILSSLTARKTSLISPIGICVALLFLLLILNLSPSSFFTQNKNDGSDGIIAVVGGGISNTSGISSIIREKGEGLESSFHNLFSSIVQYAYAKEHAIAVQHGEGPRIMVNNSNLKIETVFKGGLESPTSMAFLGPNDIFVLEKNRGAVERIVNGHMLPKPVLKVPVASKIERGMLGIAIARHGNNNNNAAVTNTSTTTTDTTNTSNAAAFTLISFKAEEGNERRGESTATTITTNNTTTYVFLYYTRPC
jgi:hypothetical protein